MPEFEARPIGGCPFSRATGLRCLQGEDVEIDFAQATDSKRQMYGGDIIASEVRSKLSGERIEKSLASDLELGRPICAACRNELGIRMGAGSSHYQDVQDRAEDLDGLFDEVAEDYDRRRERPRRDEGWDDYF